MFQRKAFRVELDRGMAVANYQVAKSIYEQAVGGNVTAAIWWTKARMGWSETSFQKDSHETKFERMSEEELIEHLQCQANELGIKRGVDSRQCKDSLPTV